MSGGGGGVSVRVGRNDEEELEDLSREPRLRREPEGLRVLSSYDVRLGYASAETALLSTEGPLV